MTFITFIQVSKTIMVMFLFAHRGHRLQACGFGFPIYDWRLCDVFTGLTFQTKPTEAQRRLRKAKSYQLTDRSPPVAWIAASRKLSRQRWHANSLPSHWSRGPRLSLLPLLPVASTSWKALIDSQRYILIAYRYDGCWRPRFIGWHQQQRKR